MAGWDDKQAAAIERREREWAKSDQQQRDDAIKAMLQHPATRRYLYWLLEVGKAVGVNAFTGDALTTAFSCGEQNVGQQVMAHLIEVAPDGFLALLKEVGDERTNRDRERAALRDATGASPGSDT